jgi:hypothetical protein
MTGSLRLSSITSKPQSHPATEPIFFDESALSLTPHRAPDLGAARPAADGGASVQLEEGVDGRCVVLTA